MGTKKGQVRKTARRAYTPRKEKMSFKRWATFSWLQTPEGRRKGLHGGNIRTEDLKSWLNIRWK